MRSFIIESTQGNMFFSRHYTYPRHNRCIHTYIS